MSLEELSHLASSLVQGIPWITFTGGEPFLREDLEQAVSLFCSACRPLLVNVATNGTVSRTGGIMTRLALRHPDTTFTLNVSLDETGEFHDRIRGKPGVFEKASSLVKSLARGVPRNLNVGVHLVISRLNLHRLPLILPELRELKADQLIAEPAQERWELANPGCESVPGDEELMEAIPIVRSELANSSSRGFGLLSGAVRRYYYASLAGRSTKQPPCGAGRLSAHVDADGTVSACCVRGDFMGRLPACDFDFSRLWNDSRAHETRRLLSRTPCSCRMANAFFTGLTLHPISLVRLAFLNLLGVEKR
jgi:MoaA/NifB/PqqE/SkfB family radical SAM enzyme